MCHGTLQAAHSAVFASEYYYDAAQAGWRDDWQLRQQVRGAWAQLKPCM